MGEIVNLNKFRKRRDRLEAEAGAAENRVRFGQRKSDRAAIRKESDKVETELDGKKLD